MNEELQNKIRLTTNLMHQIVKDLDNEIVNNLTYEDTTANNYLLDRLNKRYREMSNNMADYEIRLVAQLKNINFIIEDEKEKANLA